MDGETLALVYQTNTIGPALVSQAFLPLVERSKKRTIVNITSGLGSIAQDISDLYTSYAMAKAALNMLVGSFSTCFLQRNPH